MVQQCRRCGQMHDAYTGCTLAVRVARRPTIVGEDEALVGNVVADRYQVGDVIGVGSTGTVFGVHHVTFARPAAMKVLRPRYASMDLVSRVFHGEARAAWSVSHPCLAEVFDIGTLPDGAPFFVMERLEGETLTARLGRERLSLASAVDVMMQLLSAIAAIHARDLLLRDLRPQNIYLVHRRGCRPLLKILDFGLARLTPLDKIQEEWETLQATALPTDGATSIPYYLSPERTRGENGVDHASDLFVAAVIMYETLAGERPFVSDSFNGVLVQICQGKPIPLHDLRPDVSPELSGFVTRALSANPRARPTTAKEMQDELRAIFEGARRSPTSVYAGTGSLAAPAMPTAAITHNSQGDEATFATVATVAGPVVHHPALSKGTPKQQKKTDRPRRGAPEREPTPTADDEFAEETQTNREAISAAALMDLPRLNSEDEISTTARRIDPSLLDEASADNADRTVPPPPDVSIDISFDEAADKTMDLGRRAVPLPAMVPREDEETATMELTPELRARVDQLMASKPAPTPVAQLPQPFPPRSGKPPRRR